MSRLLPARVEAGFGARHRAHSPTPQAGYAADSAATFHDHQMRGAARAQRTREERNLSHAASDADAQPAGSGLECSGLTVSRFPRQIIDSLREDMHVQLSGIEGGVHFIDSPSHDTSRVQDCTTERGIGATHIPNCAALTKFSSEGIADKTPRVKTCTYS